MIYVSARSPHEIDRFNFIHLERRTMRIFQQMKIIQVVDGDGFGHYNKGYRLMYSW